MPRLLSINSYHYRRGGADALYLDHARMMESIGWENAFFSMHFPHNEPCRWSRYFVDEIQIGHHYSLPQKVIKATKVVYSFEAQRKLGRLVADFEPHVAHLHNIYHHLSPSILTVLKRAGIPTVLTAHDLKLACPSNKMLTPRGICERCKGGQYHQAVIQRCVHGSLAASAIIALESYLHGWLRSYARHVDRIIVPSRFFISKLVEWGWRREAFTYIPNFVDATRFAPSFRPGNYVLYFGRLALEKGVPTLLRAAAAASVPLRIVGTGPLEESLQRLAERLGANVTFHGHTSGAQLHALISGSRATVLPSEWYENAPLSVLESFALGKPMIGAAIGGIPELVVPGETGWLFKSGDADALASRLSEIFSLSDSKIEAIGRAARVRAEQDFSPEQYIKAVCEVYRSLGVTSSTTKTLAEASSRQLGTTSSEQRCE